MTADPTIAVRRSVKEAERASVAEPQIIDLQKDEDYSNPTWRAVDERVALLTERNKAQQAVDAVQGGAQNRFTPVVSERARKRLVDAQSKLASWDSRAARPVREYPTLAKAMMDNPDLTEADVRRVVNFAAAWSAADKIIENKDDPVAQTNILLTMTPPQRAAVLDILDEKQQQFMEQAQQAVEDANSPIAKAGAVIGTAANFLFENVLNPINEVGQRAQRAVTYGQQQRGGLIGSVAGSSNPTDYITDRISDIFFYWDDVENTPEGNYNPKVVDEARREYGDAPVDLMIELQTLKRQGDPSPAATLIAKYAGDPERATILRNIFSQSRDPEQEATAQKWRRLEAIINSANQGDAGQLLSTTNILTGQVAGVPGPDETGYRGSDFQQGVAGTANVASTFGNDPLIFTSKVRNAYLGAKYALTKIAPDAAEGSVRAALSQPSVAAYLDDLGRDIGRLNDTADTAVKAGLRQRIAKRYGEYFPEDVLQDLVRANVRSADDFADYVVSANNALRIARGEAIQAGDQAAVDALNKSSVMARMATGQGPRRAEQILPRNAMLWGSTVRRRISDAIFNPTPKGAGARDYERFVEQANDPTVSVGQMLNDSAPELGKAQRLLNGQSDARFSRAWDKLTRWGATTVPTAAVYVKDARDTQKFLKFARLFVPKDMAVRLADDWRNATEGQRRLMWTGIVRSAAYSRGFDDVATRVIKRNGEEMTVADLARDLVTGTRGGELYAPNQLMVVVGDETLSIPEFLQRTGRTGVPEDLRSLVDNVIDESPSNYDGLQHATHLWQTADYVAVPNLNDIALITKRSKLIQQTLGLTPTAAGKVAVDLWSMITLMGPRYSMRNALEDWFLYAVTGGKFLDAVKGRAITTGFREATGKKIGIFARQMRKVGNHTQYSFARNVLLPGLDETEVAAAHVAAREGDMQLLQQLAVRSVVRQKIGKTLSAEDEQYLIDFAGSQAGQDILDEITELAHHLNQGTFPSLSVSDGGAAIDDVLTVYPKGEFKSIAMAGDNFARFTWWQRSIEGILLADGSIGRIAVANLDNFDDAVTRVAQAIANDTRYGYRERFSAIYGANTSVDDMARRYVRDVYNTFSRRDGSLNRGLWSRFVDRDQAGNRVARYSDPDGNARISVSDLRGFNENDMPKYILGREVDEKPYKIPVQWTDRVWNMMGNQVARISREPIFFANYLSARRQYAGYQAELAAAMGAEGAEAASRTVTRMALDRAMQVTLAYTDNPANQSMLAWRMRNFARYYRATEDFYRRVYRMAKYEPIGLYKSALALHALDESGFISTDENGDRYFLYPGAGLVNGLLGQVFATFGGNRMFVSDMPLIFSGKVKMLAPSADPQQWLPMASSPTSSLLVKSVMNLVPQFKSYEQALLGDYSENVPIWQSIIPAPVMRLFNSLSQDERDSAYASAFMGAAQVMEGAGKMPKPSADEAEIDEARSGIATLATNILVTRLIMGFLYPASPQVEQNDVTDIARKYGISNMRQQYLALATKYEKDGEPDPWGRAMIDWVSTYGLEAAPYTVSTATRASGLRNLPEIPRAETTIQFAQDNPEMISKFKTASMFLAPVDGGDFSYDTARWLRENGFTKKASTDEYLTNLRLAKGKFEYFQTKDDVEQHILDATTDEERKRWKAYWDDELKPSIYADYPGLATLLSQNVQDTKDDANAMLDGTFDQDGNPVRRGEIRMLLEWYYENNDTVPLAVEKIAEAVATWDHYKPMLDQIKGQQTNAAKTQRAQIRADLIYNLQQIASEDPNAEMFIRRVMYTLLGVDRDGNPRPL